MMTYLTTFLFEESGAVSTDWVVVTGLAVGISIAMYTLIGGASADHGERIDTAITSRGIPDYGLNETTN